MTKPRHGSQGWVTPNALPRDESGRTLCRWCKEPITERRRRTFCGQPCVDQYLCRSSSAGAAQVLERRDKGVCAICGFDCDAAIKRVQIRRMSEMNHEDRIAMRERSRAELLARGFTPGDLAGRRLWDVDHIVPVIDGGGMCGPENLRTLCRPCHKRETAALAARRASERKARRESEGTVMP